MTCITDPQWYAPFSPEIAFHTWRPARLYRERVAAMIASAPVFEDPPDEIVEADGAYFIPGAFCLYDRHGHRIAQSCIRRGPQEIFNAPEETIEPPQDCPEISFPLLYMSWLPAHWGHFLTETSSRLWAYLRFPELRSCRPFFVHQERLLPAVHEFCSRINLPSGQFLSPAIPVRLQKCFIPAPSFANRAFAHSCHLDAPRAAASAIMGAQKIARRDEPVYLSRAGLTAQRSLRNEDELQNHLRAAGVRVVHIEALSLQQQIELFNAHNIFIGCFGSAFHNLSFRRTAETADVHMFVDDVPNANFLMYDALLANRAHYIDAILPTPGETQDWPRMDLTIRTETCLAHLRAAGLI
jgi:capsular polysaccharide biosynthesis protein